MLWVWRLAGTQHLLSRNPRSDEAPAEKRPAAPSRGVPRTPCFFQVGVVPDCALRRCVCRWRRREGEGEGEAGRPQTLRSDQWGHDSVTWPPSKNFTNGRHSGGSRCWACPSCLNVWHTYLQSPITTLPPVYAHAHADTGMQHLSKHNV